MTINEVTTRPVAACTPENNAAEAICLMWENDCGVLPVLAQEGAIAGIVTDRDFCIALGTRNVLPSELLVSEVLRHDVLICHGSDEVHVALERMREGKVRRLPVLNEKEELEGIVSMDDIVAKAEANGWVHSGISYNDAITTLQTINTRRRHQAAPAV